MGVIVREKIKGSGVYYVYINHNGDRKAQMVGDKDVADVVAEEVRALITLGQLDLGNSSPKNDADNTPTMNEYGKTWLAEEIKGVLDDATHERYENVLKRDIYPALGTKRINKIKTKDIKALLKSLNASGRTPRSISLTRTVLSSCLTEAVVDELIPTNPVRELTRTRKGKGKRLFNTPKVRHKVNAFTAEQANQFIVAAMNYSPETYGPMFLTGFRSGLRLGELLALNWQDIDWDLGTLKIDKSFKCGIKEPKTYDSYRLVDMSDQLKETLQALYEQRCQEATQEGRLRPYDVIFHYKGKYRAQNTARKAFSVVLKRIGMTGKRCHDMRHSFAVLLLSRGASINYIKDQMGHSSIKTTSDIYGYFIPGSNRQIVSALDDPITTSSQKPKSNLRLLRR